LSRSVFSIARSEKRKARYLEEALMSTSSQEKELRASLSRFEDCVETPVVPGELASWLDDARQALELVETALHRQAYPEHVELLRKTAREDAELIARVEQLIEAERQVVSLFSTVRTKLDLLADRAVAVESDEGKLVKPLEEFVDASLAFVLAARKQDNAVSTWYSEALNRDRGVGD
jgi:hypothetical protein